jgi:hypothetical protein
MSPCEYWRRFNVAYRAEATVKPALPARSRVWSVPLPATFKHGRSLRVRTFAKRVPCGERVLLL